MGETGDAPLARRQQLFHRKLGRGVQIHRPPQTVIANRLSTKPVQMRLIARRNRQRRRVDLDEVALCQPSPDPRLNPVALQQQPAPIRMPFRLPPSRRAIFISHLEISRHIG